MDVAGRRLYPEGGPVIDGHAHSSGEFFHGDDVVRALDEAGVDSVVLCPGPVNEAKTWPVPPLERVFRKRGFGLPANRLLRLASGYVGRRFRFVESNAYVASLAQRHAGRIVQSCWVNPGDADALRSLPERHEAWRFRGLKVHQCFGRSRSDSPQMDHLARFAGDRGLPVFIHLYARRDAAGVINLAAAHPQTAFIIGHLLGFGVFAAADRRRMDNIYFDISPPGLCPLALVKRALGVFGPEKLLLGSDTPYGKDNLKRAVARVRGLPLPDADKALILGGNARRLYSI
jgi:hypothetical protein